MKKIAFIIRSFPQKYDTFVINQILNAHNAGYEIRIFPQTLEELNNASQPEIIEHHGLMEKVIKLMWEENNLIWLIPQIRLTKAQQSILNCKNLQL